MNESEKFFHTLNTLIENQPLIIPVRLDDQIPYTIVSAELKIEKVLNTTPSFPLEVEIRWYIKRDLTMDEGRVLILTVNESEYWLACGFLYHNVVKYIRNSIKSFAVRVFMNHISRVGIELNSDEQFDQTVRLTPHLLDDQEKQDEPQGT